MNQKKAKRIRRMVRKESDKIVINFMEHAFNQKIAVRLQYIWRILTKDRALRKRLSKRVAS
jgi:hypothetical protein